MYFFDFLLTKSLVPVRLFWSNQSATSTATRNASGICQTCAVSTRNFWPKLSLQSNEVCIIAKSVCTHWQPPNWNECRRVRLSRKEISLLHSSFHFIIHHRRVFFLLSYSIPCHPLPKSLCVSRLTWVPCLRANVITKAEQITLSRRLHATGHV